MEGGGGTEDSYVLIARSLNLREAASGNECVRIR